MEIGTCPKCARPYTSSELAGFGILRPRSAAAGGPLLEYICPKCGRKVRLIPHGEGRYAPPGKPPPEYVPPAERRPPWVTEEPTASGPDPEVAAPEAPEHEIPDPPPPPPIPDPAPAREPVPEDEPVADGPMTVPEALEILGCSATADKVQIDRAFRQRSRTCHPDKVAHLDEEFQALAETKFKRLRAAYDLVR